MATANAVKAVAEEILRCSYQAQGIIATCALALDAIGNGTSNAATAGDIA